VYRDISGFEVLTFQPIVKHEDVQRTEAFLVCYCLKPTPNTVFLTYFYTKYVSFTCYVLYVTCYMLYMLYVLYIIVFNLTYVTPTPIPIYPYLYTDTLSIYPYQMQSWAADPLVPALAYLAPIPGIYAFNKSENWSPYKDSTRTAWASQYEVVLPTAQMLFDTTFKPTNYILKYLLNPPLLLLNPLLLYYKYI
jgi:hypothetical protein